MQIVFKSFGGCFVLILIFAVLLSMGLLLIKGGAWVSELLCPFLLQLSTGALAIGVVVLFPMSFIRRTQSLSGRGLIFVSYLFGFTLWTLSFSTTYNLWGGFALLVGLALAGVGVVPMAIIATLLKGMWPLCGKLIFLGLLTWGTRVLGLSVREKAEGVLSC